MVVCGDQPERHLERAPVLAVEVLSDSTRSHDVTVKRDLYLENGVLHYLVIDPDERIIQHFRLVDSKRIVSQLTTKFELDFACDCLIEIDGKRLFD